MISIKKLEKANQLHQYYIGLVQGLSNMQRFAKLISENDEYYKMTFKNINNKEPEKKEESSPSFGSPMMFFMNQMVRHPQFASGGIVTEPDKNPLGTSVNDYDFNVSSAMTLKIISLLCSDMQLQMIEIEEELKELGFEVNN